MNSGWFILQNWTNDKWLTVPSGSCGWASPIQVAVGRCRWRRRRHWRRWWGRVRCGLSVDCTACTTPRITDCNRTLSPIPYSNEATSRRRLQSVNHNKRIIIKKKNGHQSVQLASFSFSSASHHWQRFENLIDWLGLSTRISNRGTTSKIKDMKKKSLWG